MGDHSELDERQQEILATVIRQYVATGLPVGSKAVSAHFSEPLSPATIRNIMAELEAAGYLTHPHTSAGRIPTDKAYRLYVDRLAKLTRLAPAMEEYIEQSLGSRGVAGDELMEKISLILSEVSSNLGLVLGPSLEEKLLEHIKFVRLPEQRVLAVVVSRPDLIENKVFRLDEDFTQAELDGCADFLNHEFRGWSLRTIRMEMVKRVEEMKAISDRLLTLVARLLMWGALAEEAPGELFVGGAARILDQPDFLDAGKVRELLAAIEEKAKVVRILSACLEAPHRGVQALIGGENPNFEMRDCTFIVAPYHYRRRPVGALGVIGPTRMEYGRAIRTVEYIAQVTSRLLSTN
ncbi:MAG TPA: heat-inducible transcriptional repressor HrcA [Terriglobia bacterium]|nr:heat-inducible transcriptional repressor HrcA [Terriglobia bacterium]